MSNITIFKAITFTKLVDCATMDDGEGDELVDYDEDEEVETAESRMMKLGTREMPSPASAARSSASPLLAVSRPPTRTCRSFPLAPLSRQKFPVARLE